MKDQNAKIKNQNQTQNSKLELRYRAFYLSINVIKFLEEIPSRISLRVISDQLIRCITSIGANIVEARSSSSKKEFLNYFQIALKSANEAKYWLAMLKELIPDKVSIIITFINETEEISRIISASVLTMKGKRSVGFAL